MSTVLKDRGKKKGIRRLFKSVHYSVEGLAYAYKHEQSLWFHLLATVTAVCIGLLLDIKSIEWIALILALGLLLTVELINSAIEAAVDLVTLDKNPLAKVAKDCGSAATFITCILTAIVALTIFIPYIIELLR